MQLGGTNLLGSVLLGIAIVALIVDTLLPKPRRVQDPTSEALGTGWDWLQVSTVPVRITHCRWFRGALYDAWRQRITVAAGSFASSDFETLWSVAHELRHPQQNRRFYWIKFLAEGLMLVDGCARAVLTLRRGTIPAPALLAIMVGGVVLWGTAHMLLEYDACLWAPVNLWHYAVQRSCSLDQQRAVLERAVRYSRVQIISYFLMTIVFASMDTLLFVSANGIWLRGI